MIQIDTKWDILRLRTGQPVQTYVAATNDAKARGLKLREAFKYAAIGDVLYLAPGKFEFPHDGGNVLFPEGVTIIGQGAGVTHLWSDVHSDKQGTAFVLNNSTWLKDMTIECSTYLKDEDGRTVGFAGEGEPGLKPANLVGLRAKISNCRIVGNAWTIYNWNNLGNYLLVEDSEIIFGRQGVSAMGSGTEFSQYIDIYRCKFDGDASRSNDVGHTSDINHGGVYGVMARGGVVRIIDCEMDLIGRPSVAPSYTPNVIGVTDTFHDGPSDETKIELFNLRIKCIGNGSQNVAPILIKNETVKGAMVQQNVYGVVK